MRTLRVLTVAVLAFACASLAQAGWRFRHADRNKDGVVTPREAHKEHQWEKHHLSRVDTRWEKRADANGDGRVEAAEAHAYRLKVMDANRNGVIEPAERKIYWTGWKGVVDTEAEKKYDANGDGYLEWPEAKEFLRDRLRIISTDGKAIVNTDLEREFDANADGIIDQTEAAAIREALD